MSNINPAINAIATDLGIVSYPQESNDAFSSRVIYSASRMWMDALCMDDQNDGAYGITKAALTRRISNWVNDCKAIWPKSSEWFCIINNQNEIHILYERLIHIGELLEDNLDNRLKAHLPYVLSLPSEYKLIVGFHDNGTGGGSVCGYKTEVLITTGLATLIPGNISINDMVEIKEWEKTLASASWYDLNDFGIVEYINPYIKHWNLNNANVWSNTPIWIDNITLARLKTTNKWLSNFLLVSKSNNKLVGSSIEDKTIAYNLYFYMRKKLGNPICARSKQLDGMHSELYIPLLYLPEPYKYILDIISWPKENICDNIKRIIRSESLPLVISLLDNCNVSIGVH